MSDINGGMGGTPDDEASSSPWVEPSTSSVGGEQSSTTPPPIDSPSTDSPMAPDVGAQWSATQSIPTSPPAGKKGKRGFLILLALLVLLGGGGGAAYFLSEEDEPTVAELLSAAKKFVAEAKTATFTGKGTTESAEDGLGGKEGASGSSFLQRLKLKGEVSFPDRSKTIIDFGRDGALEALVVKDHAYVREAAKTSDLDEELWAKVELPPGVVKPEGDGPILDFNDPTSGGPLSIPDLLAAGKAPKTFTKDDSAYVLDLKLDPGDVLPDPEQTGLEVDLLTLTIRVEKDGKLLSYTLTMKGDAIDSTSTLNFTWGTEVKIDAPGAGEIDATPEIDEEALEKFTDAPILVPEAIPAGWVLGFAGVLSAEETVEECEEASIDYGDPENPEGAYLELYVFSADCDGLDLVAPTGSEEFRPSKASEGYVAGNPDEGWHAQFIIDGTVIQATTDLNPEELATVLAKLVIFDPAKTPGEIKGIGVKKQLG